MRGYGGGGCTYMVQLARVVQQPLSDPGRETRTWIVCVARDAAPAACEVLYQCTEEQEVAASSPLALPPTAGWLVVEDGRIRRPDADHPAPVVVPS